MDVWLFVRRWHGWRSRPTASPAALVIVITLETVAAPFASAATVDMGLLSQNNFITC